MRTPLVLLCLLYLVPTYGTELKMDGLPIQLEWFDVNGDGYEDLVALMIRTKSEGQVVDTWIEDGSLRGLYEDETIKEKFLATWVREGDDYKEMERIELGLESTLGFALEKRDQQTKLMLWREKALFIHHWEENTWLEKDSIETPGLLAGQGVYLNEFPFWQQGKDDSYWIVPDLDGVHRIRESTHEKHFLPYPNVAFHQGRLGDDYQQIALQLPSFLDLDNSGTPQLIYQNTNRLMSWQLMSSQKQYDQELKGNLHDMNGDGLLDLVKSQEGKMNSRKDIEKIKTNISVYHATAPLTFPEKPDLEDKVAGFLIDTGGFVKLPRPYIDINNDGKLDISGFTFKVGVFQIAKAVTIGRMNLKFLLHLSVQEEDGSFRALAGGPFPMTWKINIRRLKMPSFAQMAADFDGDGWVDIMVEKSNKLEVTPVNDKGFQNDKKWKFKIPKAYRDPDQVYGRDLNNDKKAEFVIMKLTPNQTLLTVLEHGK